MTAATVVVDGVIAGDGSGVPLPRTVTELRAAVAAGTARPFHAAHFPPGHRPTNSARWLALAEATEGDENTHKKRLPGSESSSSSRAGGGGGGGGGSGSASFAALEGYDVAYEPGYEPFLIVAAPQPRPQQVVRRAVGGSGTSPQLAAVPQWDCRFTGYGKNKMAHAR